MGVDELKLNLSGNFMKGIITKVLAKMIQKKLGYKIDIELNSLDIKVVDGKARLHVDADAEMNNDDLFKIIKSAGLD